MPWEPIKIGRKFDEAEKQAMIAAADKDPYAPNQVDHPFNRQSPVTETTGNADLSQSFSTNNVRFEQGEQAFDPNANGRGIRRSNANQAAGINPYDISNA